MYLLSLLRRRTDKTPLKQEVSLPARKVLPKCEEMGDQRACSTVSALALRPITRRVTGILANAHSSSG